MTTLHATPYNNDAAGFYFDSLEDYQAKAENHLDRYGNLVEEFEIQFIDGDDSALFNACGINQSNLDTWFDVIELLSEAEKLNLYYLVEVVGYSLEQALDKLEEPNIYDGNLLDAASELFDECYLPSLPDSIKYYIDYEKFARDCQLGGDMCEFEYDGKTYTCTNVAAL
jgi:hypothetical protein